VGQADPILKTSSGIEQNKVLELKGTNLNEKRGKRILTWIGLGSRLSTTPAISVILCSYKETKT
jgi:hypothetical protein